MYSTIVVPLDGSSFGECALPAAVALARRSDAALALLHVREPAAPVSGAPALDSRFDEEAEQFIRTRVSALATSIQHDMAFTVKPVFRSGDVPGALQDYVADSGADLIVMSSHGRGGFSRAWLGSVADALVHRSTVPLLLIRPDPQGQADMTEMQGLPFHRILIPLDGSFRAAAVLRHAAALGVAGDTAYLLLTVCRPPTAFDLMAASALVARDTSAQLLADIQGRAAAYLERVAAPLRKHGFGVTTHTTQHAHTGRAILDFSRAQAADLIVLSTGMHSATERLLIGSVADKVVRGSAVPVLICGPRADLVATSGEDADRKSLPAASNVPTR